jgi:hypothetical protein
LTAHHSLVRSLKKSSLIAMTTFTIRVGRTIPDARLPRCMSALLLFAGDGPAASSRLASQRVNLILGAHSGTFDQRGKLEHLRQWSE